MFEKNAFSEDSEKKNWYSSEVVLCFLQSVCFQLASFLWISHLVLWFIIILLFIGIICLMLPSNIIFFRIFDVTSYDPDV